ncbi:hypothetical protein M430DRAFT_243005 [Amorphotheca resinae ATCC 22711]|jgi:hypothetical protein|uniref:Uncharacterized protein n=1 Tax=Amorphotheca resinae ATCC 22711 TaxID=857342 RepID=A0A2T3B2D1_AMORE|nr:hypothetical protein M430DRAFT_243005 [Amorphotheca resinae ATCC 22711]PSS18714.1 hypothetical protein M430DRAFT_243005 [Amorphotheca resinae ATCC 22711]
MYGIIVQVRRYYLIENTRQETKCRTGHVRTAHSRSGRMTPPHSRSQRAERSDMPGRCWAEASRHDGVTGGKHL